MHGLDVLERKALRRDLLEKVGAADRIDDRPDSHGRLDVAAVAHVMNLVRVVDDQPDAPSLRETVHGRVIGLGIARLAQTNGIILERFDDLVDVPGRAAIAVLALQDRAHDLPRVGAAQRLFPAEPVDDEIRRIVVAGRKRRLVQRVGHWARAVALVELQARRILGADFRLRRQRLVVRQTFEEEPHRAERACIFPHALIEGTADAASRLASIGGDVVEVAEVQIGCVQQ